MEAYRAMTSRTVTTEAERGSLLKYLGGHPLPFTVSIAKGRRRSTQQNNLHHKWVEEVASQLCEMTGDDEWTRDRVQAEFKLRFGVPILREENEVFREKYDRVIKPHSYEEKLEMMSPAGFDFPVSRLMTTPQFGRYLDTIYRHYTEQGLALTDPSRLENAA